MDLGSIILIFAILFIIIYIFDKKIREEKKTIKKKLVEFDKSQLIGKSLTVELIFRDSNFRKIETYITTGIIVRISEKNVLYIRRDDETEFGVPLLILDFIKFQRSKYSRNTLEKKTDYYTGFSVEEFNSEGDMEAIKKVGYGELNIDQPLE